MDRSWYYAGDEGEDEDGAGDWSGDDADGNGEEEGEWLGLPTEIEVRPIDSSCARGMGFGPVHWLVLLSGG